MHIHKHEDVIDIDGIIAEFARLKGTRLALSFGSKNKGGGSCKLQQFVVYCVLFVMMSTNIEIFLWNLSKYHQIQSRLGPRMIHLIS